MSLEFGRVPCLAKKGPVSKDQNRVTLPEEGRPLKGPCPHLKARERKREPQMMRSCCLAAIADTSAALELSAKTGPTIGHLLQPKVGLAQLMGLCQVAQHPLGLGERLVEAMASPRMRAHGLIDQLTGDLRQVELLAKHQCADGSCEAKLPIKDRLHGFNKPRL